MRLTIFLNAPEIHLNINEKLVPRFKTVDDLLAYLREQVKNELASPKNFRIPADQLKQVVRLWESNRE